ncbi:MAG: spore coat protein CotJB [Lachnospiraceae bacterium]|nr:spore coat protein CotJB [Lachnospiraceae bacterium]
MHNQQANELLQTVDELSMVSLDLALYLDTHPQDEAALEAYFKYNDMLRAAKKEYQKYCGPLTVSHADPNEQWVWAMTPFPWQKECD